MSLTKKAIHARANALEVGNIFKSIALPHEGRIEIIRTGTGLGVSSWSNFPRVHFKILSGEVPIYTSDGLDRFDTRGEWLLFPQNIEFLTFEPTKPHSIFSDPINLVPI